MERGEAAFVFLLVYGVTIIVWRSITAQFIRDCGERSEMEYPNFVLRVAWDFLRAIDLAAYNNKDIPRGVYLHGFMLLLSVITLIYAVAVRIASS